MDRKQFLKTSALTAVAVSAFGKVSMANEIFVADCETTNDILGPFYRPDAPLRQDLIEEGMEGAIVLLSGQIFSSDCTTPLENALIELWHCSANGEYDNESEGFYYRAKWITGADGKYEFKTVLPGKYMNGNQYRPAHYHIRVTANGHRELISQLYFQGDPFIEDDHWASQAKAAKRILPLLPESVSGTLAVRFDVSL